MGRDAEKRFLENRLKRIDEDQESKFSAGQRANRPEKPPRDGAGAEIFRYQMEKEIVQKLLSEEMEVTLEERLLKRLREKARDEVEYVKRSLARRGYTQRFWSDQVYIEILKQLLKDWSEAKEKAEA